MVNAEKNAECSLQYGMIPITRKNSNSKMIVYRAYKDRVLSL